MTQQSFRLHSRFIEKYQDRPPRFGFNGLGELTYKRSYSRQFYDGDPEGVAVVEDLVESDMPWEPREAAIIAAVARYGLIQRNEAWWQTVQRVVEGVYTLQKRHITDLRKRWDEAKAQRSAQEMYERIFTFKFLPPGRGLWMMGTKAMEQRGLGAAANNCAFVTTLCPDDPAKPYCFAMDMLMLGVGVGADTRGKGRLIFRPKPVLRPGSVLAYTERGCFYAIPDTREGWVMSLRLLLRSYFEGTSEVEFDYSLLRPKGVPIRTFGGESSGPEPLMEMHQRIRQVLDAQLGTSLSGRLGVGAVVDIINLIGCCVVAGNVRRSAEWIGGDFDDVEFRQLKNWDIYPERNGATEGVLGWGHVSNNSLYAEVGDDYTEAARSLYLNGEPGLVWLENMRAYGRMNGAADTSDIRAMGMNPCCEQVLEPYELCCLVESFPQNHETKDDFHRTLKFAFLLAKSITLASTHWPETNEVLLRNRRIGTSVSGLQQLSARIGLDQTRRWLEGGYAAIQRYDETYSEWFAIPRSRRTSSVKPSGSVSLLAGATPGVHWPIARFYIRRVRVLAAWPGLDAYRRAGYTVTPDVSDPKRTAIVEVPVDAGEGLRPVHEVSMWEQVAFVAKVQRWWADNSVSATINFNPDEVTPDEIKRMLDLYQYDLKAISLLPNVKGGAYAQMPYEAISETAYQQRLAVLRPLDFSATQSWREAGELYCDSDTCVVA